MEVMNDQIDSDADEAKYVNDTVRAILILDHSKKGFKQSDLTTFLNVKFSRKQWASIFRSTIERLKEMGLILKETKNSHSKSYYLISEVFPLKLMYRNATKQETADRTLLIIVLTLIFMREGPVLDVDILNHLQELKIYNPDGSLHKYFGDVSKKIFIDFVSQLYLEKIVDRESGTVQIKWGERANAEVTRRSILEFACALAFQNTVDPKSLVSHYMKILEQEEEGPNATPDSSTQ